MKKKKVHITLSPIILQKARSHKLNISRITENALKDILQYLEIKGDYKLMSRLPEVKK